MKFSWAIPLVSLAAGASEDDQSCLLQQTHVHAEDCLAGAGKCHKAGPKLEPFQVTSIEKMASYTESYPDATDAPMLFGPIAINFLDETTVNMKGSVTGLVAGEVYMFHIHAGTSCKDAASQAKCFAGPGGCQWLKDKDGKFSLANSQAIADKDGMATWDYTSYNAVPRGSKYLGRPVVFHRMYGNPNDDKYDAPNNPRMACGLVEPKLAPFQVKSIEKMPSYTESRPDATDAPMLFGPIAINFLDETTVNMKGSVTGLVAGEVYMFHIHAGTSCKDAASQAKCFAGPGGCQWLKDKDGKFSLANSQAIADKDGMATWDYTSYNAVPRGTKYLGRPVVFHRMYGNPNDDKYDAPNNPRMACGLVEN